MKALRLVIAGILFIICGASSCQKSGNDTGTAITKEVNENFEIKLEACHDGGYMWFLESIDSTKIRLLNTTSIPVSGKPNVIGGNVYEIWTFVGLQKGEYTLSFYYKRPWLNETEQTKKMEIRIN